MSGASSSRQASYLPTQSNLPPLTNSSGSRPRLSLQDNFDDEVLVDPSPYNHNPLKLNDLFSIPADEACELDEGDIIGAIANANIDVAIECYENEEECDADGGESDEEGIVAEEFGDELTARELDHVPNTNLLELTSDKFAFAISDSNIRHGMVVNEEEVMSKVTAIPSDWVPPRKLDPNEPNFEDIDNPGNWNQFAYQAKYKKTRQGNQVTHQYLHHALPTGCQVAPKNEEGQYIINDWELHYDGKWKSKLDHSKIRSGASLEENNLFPNERRCKLDIELLKKHGLTRERMAMDNNTEKPDSLFFHQLLLPICDPDLSGIEKDKRLPFYSKVEHFSNFYKFDNGLGTGSYSHQFQESKVEEWVRFDGILGRDALLGKRNVYMMKRWEEGGDFFDKDCSEAMNYQRFFDLKRIYKLNKNRDGPERGQPGYNPAQKFDLIYKTLVENTKYFTKYAGLDLTADETTWGHMGFAPDGVIERVNSKPGVSKGGQTLLVMDSKDIRIYYYAHRHKYVPAYNETGFTAKGPAEMKTALHSLEQMVEGHPGSEKKLFCKHPHITCDNYFNSVELQHFAGEKGFGITATTRRDRLPKQIPSKFLHREKTKADRVTKVARFFQPVVAVHTNLEKRYEIVLISFQSTSSTNIMCVNALTECKNFLEVRARGRKVHKRLYVIEQNHGRRLYLKTYSRIDSVDHLIKNIRYHYTTWKYWHAPVNHAKSICVLTAYSFYKEIAQGNLDPDLKIIKPVDLNTFLEILSKQQCQYDPRLRLYPGDEKMRTCTQQHKKRRVSAPASAAAVTPPIDEQSTSKIASSNKELCRKNVKDKKMTLQQYKMIDKMPRLCKTIDEYHDHLNSFTDRKDDGKRITTNRQCAVCKENTRRKCEKCDIFLCYSKEKNKKECFYQFHSKLYCGLTFEDRKLFGIESSDWKPWSKTKFEQNKKHIEKLEKEMKRRY